MGACAVKWFRFLTFDNKSKSLTEICFPKPTSNLLTLSIYNEAYPEMHCAY